MRKMIVTALSLMAFHAGAKVITPMGIVEKVSYQISGLSTKGLIDAHFAADTSKVTIQKTSTGYDVVVLAPSASANQSNQLNLGFDTGGKATSYKANFVSASPMSPLFPRATAAELLDLGAEAFVDHLGEATENVTVAESVQTVTLIKNELGILLDSTLSDGRTYHLQLDLDGKVISRGF
jgi:hypothetical protein